MEQDLFPRDYSKLLFDKQWSLPLRQSLHKQRRQNSKTQDSQWYATYGKCYAVHFSTSKCAQQNLYAPCSLIT